jgi:hypothetical protein
VVGVVRLCAWLDVSFCCANVGIDSGKRTDTLSTAFSNLQVEAGNASRIDSRWLEG